MTFERLWLLALLPLVALVVWRGARAWRGEVGARRRLVLALQSALLVTLALAAAGPRWVHSSDRLAVIVLLDRSRSTDLVPGVEGTLRRLLDEAPRGMRARDLVGVVSFAREADTARVPSPARGPLALPPAPSSRDATDLAGAIQHALGELPADTAGRLVLISDGDETTGDARTAALLAGASGVPVDVVALERPERRDVSAARLRAPERVEPGAPIDLALVVRASRPGGGRVELLRDGRRVGQTEARWGAGEDVVHLRDEAQRPGLHRYEVRLVPSEPSDDQVVGNEGAAGFVRVAGAARAVVVDGQRDRGGGEALATALRAAGLEVDLVGPTSAPGTAGEWGRYDLVVLSEVRARELDPEALPVLREQVRELGAGLWMTGSDRAFGPGGYGQSPVEDVLPVTLDLRRHRNRGVVAVAIVIDKSGSMTLTTRDGRQKIELANEAAARSGAMLTPMDYVTILHVDTEVEWTLPMRHADDPAAIARAAHRGSGGGGGILTDVGLRAAYEALGRTEATIRHVILLSDGDDSENIESCPTMVEAARRRSITTSVVAIGRGHDEAMLARLARLGEGRYYLTEDARALPAIFTEETVLAARNAIREEPFRPAVIRASEVLRGVDPAAIPRVAGYVVTEPRGRAEVLLEALEHDPWLARWQVGVGRSAALMSDADGRWTRDFLGWSGSSALFGQLGRWLARGVQDSGVRVAAVPSRGRVRIEVDATTTTGRWDTGLDLEARVVGPGGETVRVPLEARSAGRYEAEVEATRPGAWLVTVTAGGAGVVGVTGAEVVTSAEVTSRRGDAALLSGVAERSRGRVRTTLDGVFRERVAPKRTTQALAPWLWALALAELLALVAFRRLARPSPAGVRALWARLWSKGAAPESAAQEQEAALEALRAFRAEQRERTERARSVEVSEVSAPRVSVLPPEPPRPEAPSHPPSAPGETPSSSLDALVARKRTRVKK